VYSTSEAAARRSSFCTDGGAQLEGQQDRNRGGKRNVASMLARLLPLRDIGSNPVNAAVVGQGQSIAANNS
jgi:hypothetical protein